MKIVVYTRTILSWLVSKLISFVIFCALTLAWEVALLEFLILSGLRSYFHGVSEASLFAAFVGLVLLPAFVVHALVMKKIRTRYQSRRAANPSSPGPGGRP